MALRVDLRAKIGHYKVRGLTSEGYNFYKYLKNRSCNFYRLQLPKSANFNPKYLIKGIFVKVLVIFFPIDIQLGFQLVSVPFMCIL